MIPEKEREAIMRLTMCARRNCSICKYNPADWNDCDDRITEAMHTLADALREEERDA